MSAKPDRQPDEAFTKEEWQAATARAQEAFDDRYLLEMARYDADRFRARIALLLKAFYFDVRSVSSIQPLLALAVELNPELMEQRR